MSYQALYRVYRPQRFEDIVGQETITKTLKHAVAEHKTSHAYLFTGPRGTGKTSAAKILSKAVNCPDNAEGEPCEVCDICRQIKAGSLNDVIEIDAASNNGVEEIRDIREKANYAPTQADYKVYIIDEVHMLSQGAFNALLKTLEEPPKNVIFILATTEPHKIPLTIISRTQRFDFKRISDSDIINRMAAILEEEKVAYEPEVLDIIAQNAGGGMRDALSILDQTISFALDKVTVEDAMQVTGALTQDLLHDYLMAVKDQSTQAGLAILQDILEDGKDPGRFVEDVILFSRDILVYKQKPDDHNLLKRAQLTEDFEQLSGSIEENLLYAVIKIFNETQHELRLSNHAPVYLEVATVRLTQLQTAQTAESAGEELGNRGMETIKALQDQFDNLKDQIQNLSQAAPAKLPVQTGTSRAQSPAPKKNRGGITFTPNKNQIFTVLEQATKRDLDTIRDLWPDLLNALSTSSRAVTRASKPVAASPTGAVISFQYDILCQKATEDQNLQNEIQNFLEKVTGQMLQLVYVTEPQWPKIRQEFIDQMKQEPVEKQNNSELVKEEQREQHEQENEENQVVSQAYELFGEEIVTIKDE